MFLGLQLGSWQLLREKVSQLVQHIRTTVLNDARIDILAPRPVRGLIKLALRGDKKVKKTYICLFVKRFGEELAIRISNQFNVNVQNYKS